jgi:large subunit ribosomal protein L5
MSNNNLKQRYQKEIAPRLAKEFGEANVLAAPRLEKVVINVGIGEAAQDKSLLNSSAEELAAITGQRPKICKARKAIADFKIQAGDPIGLVVTLRGKRMYDFLEKLFKIILPRLRDFHGVSLRSFDGRGNYTLGLPEQTVFPEVDFGKITKVRGLEITFMTNAKDDEKGRRLLEELGMPFAPPLAGAQGKP